MRVALATTVLAAAVLVTFSAAATATATGTGTATVGPRRIAAAVAKAERSSSLWATVNICSSRKDPDSIGIRGQMPTLGFQASLSMVIQVDYWSTGAKRFVPIQSSTATTTLALGRQSTGLQQDGAIFPFKAHTGLLNATVTFTWRRAGKVLGQTTRRTTSGHPDADYGSPPHFTAAQCTIR
jgi:hypothetical protein